MQIKRKKTVEVEEITDVLCDKCGKSQMGECRNLNGARICLVGQYDSTDLPDGQYLEFDVCESCIMAWVETFEHDVFKNMNDASVRDLDTND